MDNLVPFFNNTLLPGLISVATALVILFIVYMIAKFISNLIGKALGRTNIDNRIADAVGGGNWPVENIFKRVIFWLIMLFGFTMAFERLNLGAASAPIQNLLDQVFGFLPTLASALILAVVAFVIGTILRTVVTRAAEGAGLDQRLGTMSVDENGVQKGSLAPALGLAAFGFVVMMFLPGILGKLGMGDLVAPVQGMLDGFLGFIPKLIGAAIIGVVGYFVAKILRDILKGVLSGFGVDRVSERAGLDLSISDLVSTLVFAMILLMTITQALAALEIDSISGPATSIIDGIFGAIPSLFGAALVLGISYMVGNIVRGLVTSVLNSANFDNAPAKLGFNLGGSRTPSELGGLAALVAIMLLAATSAIDILKIDALSNVFGTMTGLAGNIFLGIVFLGLGVWLAQMARGMAEGAGASKFTASLVRAVVLVLTGAMALNQMGIGESIVELAFGIGLGAIGIAAALAFGLGGRDTAGRELESFVNSVKSGD